MMNILITGASGMLGGELVNFLSNEFNLYGTGNSEFKEVNFRYKKFDLLSDNFNKLIKWSKPDIIIHCGALTNGNYCEENPNSAFNINGISIQKILQATNSNVKVIYISTDAVFPSKLHLAKESDCVLPENVYGKSKELGEFFLNTAIDRKFTIVRTTIVGLNANKSKTGFVEWIINTAKNNKKIGLFSDVLFNPISIWDLANELKFLIKSNNINSETLHIGGELCTKYDFGKKVLEALNISTNKLFESSILSFSDRAKRSTDQSIDSSFYQERYKRSLPSLKQTVNSIKTHYYEQN
jgi:dTDP-4-dehydrorhamnose reductase